MAHPAEADSAIVNFAGVGVRSIPGRTMDGSQLGLFCNNAGNVAARRARNIDHQVKERFDPLYGQIRLSRGRFPQFFMTTDLAQGRQDALYPIMPFKSAASAHAPRAVLMGPSHSEPSSVLSTSRPFAKMVFAPTMSISSSTTSSDHTSSSFSGPLMDICRADMKLEADPTPPFPVPDLGTPHLSSSSPGTTRASPNSVLTMASNAEVHGAKHTPTLYHLRDYFEHRPISSRSNPSQRDPSHLPPDAPAPQQHEQYRQSGLDALDMAFWNGENLYSDHESDSEQPLTGTQDITSVRHADFARSDAGCQNLSLPSEMCQDTSNSSQADSITSADDFHATLIDDYLYSGVDTDEAPVSRSSYPSSQGSYNDEAWIQANKRKSHVIPGNFHGSKNPTLTTWEPLQPKEGQTPVPASSDSEKKCRRCHQKIMCKVVKSADGLFSGLYHRECLRCVDCDTNLFRTNIFVLNDQTYCATDFHLRNGSTCHKCGMGIEGVYKLAYNNTCYHTHCFICAYKDPSSGYCHTELEEYYMIREEPYCEHHARILVKQRYKDGKEM